MRKRLLATLIGVALLWFCIVAYQENVFRQEMTYRVDNHAQVAELVDAPASGAGYRKVVEVQVLSWAPLE